MPTDYTITAKYPSKIFQYKKTAMYQGTLDQIKEELVKFLAYERTETTSKITEDGLTELLRDNVSCPLLVNG